MIPRAPLKFPIYKKIALGFLAVLSLSGFMAAVGFSRLEAIRQVADELRPFAEERTRTRGIDLSFDALDTHLEQFVTIGGEDSRAAVRNDVASIEEEVRGLAAMETAEADPAFLRRTTLLVGILRERIETFLYGGESTGAREFNEQLQGVYETLRNTRDARTDLIKYLDEQFIMRVDKERSIISSAVQTFFFLEVLTLLIGLIISIAISRVISAPIRALNLAANKIAEGDYLARADVNEGDETGELGRSFNVMAEHLAQYTHDLEQQVLTRTKELSDKVAALDEANQRLDKNASLLISRDTELTEANERLRELDKAKSDFLSVAAHQLRTPLSAVHWVNSVLLEEEMGKLTDEQKSYVMKAEESNNRMIHLVDEMLTITRMESGKLEYHFYALPLNDILGTVVQDFLPKAKEKELKLTYTSERNIATDVSVDPEKIRFVFENLLENAIRYTPKGGTVEVMLTRKKDLLLTTIKDSGIGISEKDQKTIFTKFFRAANAARVVTDGSGLGLFLAKTIALRHGGTVTFESVLGKGSTFTVFLPALPVTDSSSAFAKALHPTAPVASA